MRRIFGGGRSRSPTQRPGGPPPSDGGPGGQRRPPPARPGETSTVASQGSVGSLPAASVPASTDGLDQKIRILRDDMLKQLKDLLAQSPSQDMISLVDMLSQEANALVQDLHNHVETCMRYEQFDLVEQIVTLSSEYEELSANAQRWKAAATGQAGQAGHAPAPGSHHSPSPAASLGLPGIEPRGVPERSSSGHGLPERSNSGHSGHSGHGFPQRAPSGQGLPERTTSGQGLPERSSSGQGFAASPTHAASSTGFQAALAGVVGAPVTGSTSSAGGLRSPTQGTDPQRHQEQRPPGASPFTPYSAISDAQRRQEDASRQEEEDRFGSFPQFDDRLPAQSDLGGLPVHGSSNSRNRRPPASAPAFQSPGGTPASASRPPAQNQRLNEARQTLKTTLEGSMREDPTVLQWALSEARQAGVGEVDPVLIEEGEQTLERVNALQQEQLASQGLPGLSSGLSAGLQGLPDMSPGGASLAGGASLPDDTRSVRSLGVASASAQSVPRQDSFMRQASSATAAEREAAELQRRATQELQNALHGGDIDRLIRAIDGARTAGLPHPVIKRAEAFLMAMKFAQGKLDKRPVLRAWRAHIADLRSSRQVLKEALHRGVGADDLEEAVDAASEAGVDEETCDMARTVANHRRAAHDQAACALASMDPDDLREANAMNQAAGGPKSDEDQLKRALAQAEEDSRMMQSWDNGLPTAVDRYFQQLELEQKETQARIARARQLEEETRRTEAQNSQKALQSTQLESGSPEAGPLIVPPSPQAARRSSSQQSLRSSASQREIARAAEEWESEYSSMKSRVERARRWFATQERHHQHDEFASMKFGGGNGTMHSGSLMAHDATYKTTLPNFGTEPLPQKTGKRSLSRRRHVCGPGDEDELPSGRSHSPASPRVPQTDHPRGMQQQTRSEYPRAMQTEYPKATQTASSYRAAMQTELPQSAAAHNHGRSPPRAGPSRRRQICGPSDHDEAPPPSARQEVHESRASLGAQSPHHSTSGAPVDKMGASAVAPPVSQSCFGSAPPQAAGPPQSCFNTAPPTSAPVQFDPPATWRSTATMPLEDTRWDQRPGLASPNTARSPLPADPPAARPTRPVAPYQAPYSFPGENPPFAALPQATPAAVEPKVQASRNIPSRYKMGQAPEATPSRPVLLGQQQPVPSECPYPSSSALRSNPGGPMPVQAAPGEDVAGGAGYGYGGYEDLRGASTYHNLMANAARIARKPEAEPRRHYEDPTYWR